MKVETVFERNFRLIFENLLELLQNPDDEVCGKSLQEKLKTMDEKYKKNMLFDLLKKKLFDFGIYHHQEFSSKLFTLKKRKVEKLLETFKNDGVSAIISNFVSQLYIQLEESDFGELIQDIVKLINSTIYDGNHLDIIKKMKKEIPLEIFKYEDEDDEDKLIEFEKVSRRMKLEKDMIIFDQITKMIYWSKESFETFVQQVKRYQKSFVLNKMGESAESKKMIELIGKIRAKQTRQIIEINSIGQSDLSLIPLELRTKIEKMKQENESVRGLISQGFNASSFHFILEFIQNADDSDYLGEGVLEFDFDSKLHSLKIKSNECGFTYDNLYALAGMADSDKVSKKLESPAIGEKGIGFKTVFSVCNQIRLSSNGFDVFLTSLDLVNNKEKKEFGLIEGTEYEMMNVKKFDHSIFDKYTLLTLKNIRKIIFKDNEKTTIYSLSNINESNEFVLTTIVNGKTIEKEIFHSFSTTIDMRNILCEKRSNFHKATLIIFYPDLWDNKRFKLHSYLPVKEDYNLPLLIQSDFILIQNRESLVEDSEWNISIINSIPQLILNSYDKMKEIKDWKYNIFKMLQDCPKSHFKELKSQTVELFKKVKCIPVMDESNFELPSNVILMQNSPLNPFEVFGVDECTKILGKHCIDPDLEEYLVKEMFSIESLNANHVEKLVKELPYQIKLDNIIQLYELIDFFEIDVLTLNVEIIPTKLSKLVKPTETKCCFDQYDFSDGALSILEKVGYHRILPKIEPFFKKKMIPLKKHSDNPDLSFEERFVLYAEETYNTFISDELKLCLTIDGEWLKPSICYLKSEHTQYLENAEFVDSSKLLTILKEYKSKISSPGDLEKVLKIIGVKEVPILFNKYVTTDEFEQLKKECKNLEGLIRYFDNNIKLFEKQKDQISHYLNNQVEHMYNSSLRGEFGDILNYLPLVHNFKLNAKPKDLHAYTLLIRKKLDPKSVNDGLEFSPISIKRLLCEEPLLQTEDGEFVKLDDNLFYSLNEKVKKYKPEWKEIHRNYKKYGKITNILETNKVKTSDLKLILKEKNPSPEDQQYFISTILDSQTYLDDICVTINGQKKLLSTMFWDIKMREVFSPSVNEKLFYPQFPSTNNLNVNYNYTIKQTVEKYNKIQKHPELCTLLKDLLKKIVRNEVLDYKERTQLEILISSKFEFTLSDEMVWDLEELKNIEFFESLNLTRQFGESARIVKEHDNKKERIISELKIKEFLMMKITDNDFLKVWKYVKRFTYQNNILKFILNNGLIVHNNEKHQHTSLYRNIEMELVNHFPHLQSFLVGNQYNEFQISQEIPIQILCKEIEKLENSSDINETNKKCFILYKEIDRQIKEGTIDNDLEEFKKFKIFRNEKGNHLSEKIYYLDNQESYQHLSSLVDCLFACDTRSISHFLQAFGILPLSQNVSYKNLNTESSVMNFETFLERTKKMFNNINQYLTFNNFKSKTITVQVIKSIKVIVIIDNRPAKEISPDIHPDIENGIIYIKEDICSESLFKEKKFIYACLQFYPQLEESVQDLVKLLILSHAGTQESIAMSLILPFDTVQ